MLFRNKNYLVLLLILITGALLRLLYLTEIPFTHDEFSALSRLHFSSLPELVEKGIIIDGHPAGVQVFLFYWTKLFGWSEVAIKLPFIIMGILAIYMMFLIGREWYNDTVGLIGAAFVATMQFTVMYSQIARPYGSGMFLCLAMVYFWSRLLFKPENKYWWNFAFYVLFSALCAYNHHFSLLFAAIVGLTGLFFVGRKLMPRYILCGVAIFVLYIPHLNIFFYQLSVGGIESWLAKPQNDFLLDFTGYLFHYSTFVYLLVAVLVAYGFYRREKQRYNYRLLAVSVVWFLLPMLAGFLYSRYVAAVLQASMMIFSFPYIFFILFGHYKNEPVKINALIVASVLLINITTLVLERRHFELVRLSPYEQFLIEHRDVQQQYPGKVLSILDSHKEISDYYIKKDHIPVTFIWADTLGKPGDFGQFLKSVQNQYEYLYFGAITQSNPVLVPIIMETYPCIVWQKNYCGGTAYLFSRTGKSAQSPVFSTVQDYEEEVPRWNNGQPGSISDSVFYTGSHAYLMDSLQEYGPSFSAPLKSLIRNRNNFIDISLHFRTKNSGADDLLLVSSLDADQTPVDWRAAAFADYVTSGTDASGQWVKVFHTIKLSDIYLHRKNIMLTVYVWNKARRQFYVDDFTITTRNGNPLIYALYEKF